MSAFEFFKNALSERRNYDLSAGHVEWLNFEINRLRAIYPEVKLPEIEHGPIGNWGSPSLTVSHFFVPPRSGVGKVEEEFGIKLPADFVEFYQNWNEGILITRNPVKIMNPTEIIRTVNELRTAQDIPDNLPHRIVRFGDLGNSSYFLLRYRHGIEDWEILCSSYSQDTDADLQEDNDFPRPCDKTFSEWLQRMVVTDGVPLHPLLPDEDDKFNQRVI